KFVPVVRQLNAGNVDSQAIPKAGPFPKSIRRPRARAASNARLSSSYQSLVQAGRSEPCQADRLGHAIPSLLLPLRSRLLFFLKLPVLPKPLLPEPRGAKCNTTCARLARFVREADAVAQAQNARRFQ